MDQWVKRQSRSWSLTIREEKECKMVAVLASCAGEGEKADHGRGYGNQRKNIYVILGEPEKEMTGEERERMYRERSSCPLP